MFPNYIRAPNGAEAKPVNQLFKGQREIERLYSKCFKIDTDFFSLTFILNVLKLFNRLVNFVFISHPHLHNLQLFLESDHSNILIKSILKKINTYNTTVLRGLDCYK